jgi:glycosyltransferase involved in cell wall biosynthesis
MNIGIDAKWFFKGNPSGKVVVRNLIRELLAADKDNQYFIFLQKDDKGKLFPYQAKNVKTVYIWSPNNLLSNVFVTPYFAWKYKIDVFLYQYFGPFVKFSKIITLIHDVIFESNPNYFSFKERLYFKPMQWLAKRADMVVTVSKNEKDRLVRYHYGSDEKIKFIYLGVSDGFSNKKSCSPEELDRVRKKYRLPDSFVLYVGRLNYRKNIHNLIKAFQFVPDKNVKLVLAGNYDWKMFDVQQLVRSYGLEEKVLLPGFIDDKDLPCLYAMSKLFCFVSFDEGFGLPPLEAMASGTPVIVADKGSLPEVCGKSALYVDPNNPQTIGATISNLIHNDTQLSILRERGLIQAASFSWKNTALAYLALFNQVVKKGK